MRLPIHSQVGQRAAASSSSQTPPGALSMRQLQCVKPGDACSQAWPGGVCVCVKAITNLLRQS